MSIQRACGLALVASLMGCPAQNVTPGGTAEKKDQPPANPGGDTPTRQADGGVTMSAASETIMLITPEPLSTNVSGPLVFEVDVNSKVAHPDIEASISLQSRQGAAVSGQFSWQAQTKTGTLRTDYLLTFTPTKSLSPDTDYRVTLVPRATCTPEQALDRGLKQDSAGAWHTFFSTGSSPRVTRVRVISKDPDNSAARYVVLRMSESTDVALVRAGIAVTAGGAEVTGSIQPPTAPSGSEFQYFFSKPVAMTQPITFSLASQVRAVTGSPISVDAWDASAFTGGKFSVSLSNLQPCLDAADCWEWRPSVSF